MSSSDAGGPKAHATSLGGSAPLHRRSPGAPSSTPTPTPTPSARRVSAPRDSAQRSATGSVGTRPSAGPAALTARSRAGSSAALVPPGADRVDRDSHVSYTSIVDDPFFQRLDLATNLGSGPYDKSSPPRPRDDSNGNGQTQRWPHSRRESLTIGPLPSYWSHSSSAMESYNIAVIGTCAVGKSSFIQHALGLPRPPISNVSSTRIVVDSVAHSVSLLELDLDCFELRSPHPISWPKQINGNIVPRVDAALVAYDVMNRESILQLPQIVAALTDSDLSTALVACKCDSPKDDWEVDADTLASHELFGSCIASYKASMDKPDVSRACLQTILRAAVSHRRGIQPASPAGLATSHAQIEADESGEAVSRKRAQSAANLEVPDPTGGRPLSENSKYNRASSDFSLVRGLASAPADRSHVSRSPRPGFRIDRPVGDSFLELEESDGETHRYSDDIPILQRCDDNVMEKPPKMAGVTFDELVDRLLAMRLTIADNNFSDVFLCLYRKFAAPGELFSAILVRLNRVRDDKTAHYLSKTATQLRIIEVVAKWVSLYPGDFARPTTRRNLENFITQLSTEPIFSLASQQMSRNLQFNVIVDDDTGWANADDAGDEMASKILSKEMSELSDGVVKLRVSEEADGRPSNSSETSAAGKGSSIVSQVQVSSYDEYEREAALLEPKDSLPMDKARYHAFMDISVDDIAEELTRIDWVMFSSIRVRDFVRHVSLSAAQKEKCKSLRSVNRMINHFNHVAKWVANMILLRDKAKHRAQMLLKFMHIALKLRQLNNYNELAAVLAGINGTAVHRLAQTRALISIEEQKRFARLIILMGTQKSHFAYRLAWENTPLPRIPFIPLHRRDLVTAEEGNRTFVGPNGDRINWRKFEVLGEVLLPMMKSQGVPYRSFPKHDVARDLILGCRMPTDDEEIYQRSVQLESSSSGPAEPGKKKFPWFAK